MRRTWREADRVNDLAGFPVHRTIGATETRNNWSSVLYGAIRQDEVIRIRHQHQDEPVLLMRESRFRALERAVPGGAFAALPEPTAECRAEGAAFLTQILGPE